MTSLFDILHLNDTNHLSIFTTIIRIIVVSLCFITPTSFFAHPVFAESLKINEILVNPSEPNQEWVEFYNPGHVDLTNYWLDDDTEFATDSGNSRKKSLSSLILNNPDYPYLEFSSFLNNDGDNVVLFAPEGVIIDQYHYASDPGKDKSIGRNPDGIGEMVLLESVTKGGPNSPPLSTPTPSLTPTLTLTPTVKPSSTPKSVPSHTPTPTTKPIPSPTPVPTDSDNKVNPENSSTVLAAVDEKVASEDFVLIDNSTPSSKTAEVIEIGKSDTSRNMVTLILVGVGVIIFAGSIFLFFLPKKVT